MAHHRSPQEVPPSYFESYSPEADRSALAQHDIAVARSNRAILHSIIQEILHQQPQLSSGYTALLQGWSESIFEILDRGQDSDWNFYDKGNWKKIHDRFEKIRQGKRRPSMSSANFVKYKPYAMIQGGVIVEEFQPGTMIAALKLTTVLEGRKKELLSRLGEIDNFIREHPLDLDYVIAWNTPLVKYIEKNNFNYIDSERWRTIVVVLRSIHSHLESNREIRNTFLETFPYDKVLRKMGIDAEATPAYSRSLGRARRHSIRSHFAASLSHSDESNMTSRQRGVYRVGY
ncbi:hypothetical protein JCM5350_006436 [Sporobolomyces pararoseus]